MTVRIKVCGLRRPEDAREAFALGADFGGVIGHPGSPRYVAPGEEFAVLAEIPSGKRVWVAVEPSEEDVAAAFARGFDFAQVHFDPAGPYDPRALAESTGAHRLWLAPRLANPLHFRDEWLGLAGTFLIDGFSKDRMGGTGKRVEGEAFAELIERYPQQAFTIAGGISPENLAEVLQKSRARQIDVNSGVESSPGVKDLERMGTLFADLRAEKS